jgi:predicted dehydrogenase
MIRIGLVGCGYWGANLCRVLAQHPGVELCWVCDASPAALDRGRRIAPEARSIRDLETALSEASVDAVVVAVPVEAHYKVAKAVLAAGKHVLVEKPLSRTAAEAGDLCIEAERRSLVLMVGHTFLYNGAVRLIKTMIDAGDLGDIRYVLMRRLNLGVVRKDVDALWNLAPHDLSILNFWIDRPVTRVGAVGHSYLQPGIADVVFAHLTYEGNISGHIQVSWLDPNKVRQATVVGSRKMLIFDDMSVDSRITVFDKGIDVEHLDSKLHTFETFSEYQLIVRAGDVWLPRVEFKEPLIEEIDDFVGCIQEGRRPVADGASGLEVVKLLERLSSAMERGVLDAS